MNFELQVNENLEVYQQSAWELNKSRKLNSLGQSAIYQTKTFTRKKVNDEQRFLNKALKSDETTFI